MEKALAESCGYRIGNDKIFDLNFRLDIISETAWLSLKLTSAQFRFRGIRIFSEAAVRPTIANTMIWLSTPSKHDIFLDPFCGSGTIPTERSLYPSRKILASDISERAISIAKQNVTSEVIVRRADACNLNLAQNSITSIVTNLPWGIQIKTEDIEKLYYTFFKQVQAILAPTGTAIVLTDKETELIRACSSPDLSVKKLTMLSLHGLHPSIFKIFK
jgi:23S rRNA G2445 N2-methylase RlmL